MPERKAPKRVLAITASEKFPDILRSCLPAAQFQPIIPLANAGEAKRALGNTNYDIVVIDAPVGKEQGIQLALDIASQHSVGILLLVRSELYEQASYRVEDAGIVTLPKPTTKSNVYTAVKALVAVQARIRAAERETMDLKDRMEEIRLVNRAKWVLIDKLQMTEAEAHHYIEKQAMDRCVRKKEIAENIIHSHFERNYSDTQ